MASEIALPQGSASAPDAQAGTPAWRRPWALAAWATLALMVFWAGTGTTPTAFVHLWKWLPTLLRGLLANIEISVLAMALGTLAGLLVGAVSLSPFRLVTAGDLYTEPVRNFLAETYVRAAADVAVAAVVVIYVR